MDPTAAVPMAQGLQQLQGWLLAVVLLAAFAVFGKWAWTRIGEKDSLLLKLLGEFMATQNENINTLKSLEQSYRASAERERETAENLKSLNETAKRVDTRTENMAKTLDSHCVRGGERS